VKLDQMSTTANHKELAAHLRGRLRHEGIAARVNMQSYCGERVVSVTPATYEGRFTHAEQRTIGVIADVNGLSFSQGMAIDTTHDNHGVGFSFYMGYR
jgi:hypothetical protein